MATTTSVGIRSMSCILWQVGHRTAKFAIALFPWSPSRCATSRTASIPNPQWEHTGP
jgi:hypothetical protein